MLAITGLFTLLALVPLFWIIGYVIYKGGQYINLDFFIHLPRPLGMAGGGVLNAIEGTLVLTILASIFAVPPGILAAYYVAYKPNYISRRPGSLWDRRAFRSAIHCYRFVLLCSDRQKPGALLRSGGGYCPGNFDAAHHHSYYRRDDQAGTTLPCAKVHWL